jgi:hypothetical protein
MYYFIGGFPRTGTTLTAGVIHSDPDVNPMMAEIVYVHHLLQAYTTVQRGWANNKVGMFDDKLELETVHTAVLQVFFDHLMNKYNVKKLVMKSPFLTAFFPVLADWFPESQYIVCVRDPRDVMGSLKRVQRQHFRSNLNEHDLHPFLEQSLQEFCWAYNKGVMDCVLGGKDFPGRIHVVKYEDLVIDPTGYCRALGELLDLDLSTAEEVWRQAKMTPSTPFYSKGWGKKITTDNIGKYKTQLTREEVEVVETMCEPIMEVFNYG